MKGDAQRMLNVLTASEARKTEFVKKHFFQINTPAPPTAKVSLPGGPHSHQELWRKTQPLSFPQLDSCLIRPDTEGSHIQYIEGRIWQLGLEWTEEVSQQQKYLPLII